MTALSKLRLFLALIIAIFAGAATYMSYAIVERQNLLREVSRYNVVWASSQALTELVTLEQRLAEFAVPGSGVGKQDVQLRFDIMFNRVNVLRGGDLMPMLAQDPEQMAAVDALETKLAELDPFMAALKRPEEARDVLERLKPLEPIFKRFAARANQFGGTQVAEDHRVLLNLHWIFSGLAAGLVLCGLGFIAVLLIQNRVISRARDELHELSEGLRAAKEAAELASSAKSRFLANMSHELRTPLNAIVGFSGMIAEESLGPVGLPKYREYARDIVRSGTHMTELIGDILTMAKLEAGHFELEMQVLEPRELVKSTLAIFRGTELARGADIAVETGADWPRLRADERALRQMLLNLLSNAIKFSERGKPVRISARLLDDGGYRLAVADQGVGMTAQQAKLAVQPFRQVDESLTRKHEGTGLGLSIVKNLVEAHGGRLVVESEPRVGTKISLVLPASLIVAEPLERVA